MTDSRYVPPRRLVETTRRFKEQLKDFERYRKAEVDYMAQPYLKPGTYLTIEEIYIWYKLIQSPYMGLWCNGDCYDHNIREVRQTCR